MMNHEMGQFPSFHDIFWHFQNTLITQFLWSFLGWLTAEWTNLWSYTAVSTVTTEQQCLVPGTIHRQYTELFICPAPHQKQPGEIMTNISLGGAHWWCLLYVVVIFPIFAAPPGGQCVESGADTICRWQPGSGQSGDITADKLRL